MSIDLAQDELLTLSQACRLLPRRPSPATLWRWRTDGKVPMGRSSNSNQVYFTAGEVAAIEEYAFGLKPIEALDPTQLRLFSTKGASG